MPRIERSRIGSGVRSSLIVRPDQADRGENRAVNDPRRTEPIGALPAIEHELHQAEPDHQQDDAGVVGLAALGAANLQVSRVMDERPYHQECRRANRQVDVEIPAPVPVVGDPSAQRRAHDRRDHQAHPPRRHRELLLVGRERLHQDGLRRRHHRRARRALNQPKDDHLIERLRGAAEARRRDEHRDRRQEVALAPEARRDPSGHRNHDPVGDQVAGEHPCDLVDARRKAALHMRQRDVDDRRVEHLERRPEHHGQRDQPLVARRPVFGKIGTKRG